MASGYEAMKQLLADRPDIDGVFCATDSMGQGAMMALKEAGKEYRKTFPSSRSATTGRTWSPRRS